MKTNLENFKELELDKKALSKINGGKGGYYALRDGRLIWVDK